MCLTPYKNKQGIPCPCGKCDVCKKRRASAWGFRLLKEAERSSSAFFITLTYDPEHCPKDENGRLTLDKRLRRKYMDRHGKEITEHTYHISEWIKKLRKIMPEKLKYYAVGEYGSTTERPHYHVLLFNADLELLIGKHYYQMYKYKQLLLDGTHNIKIKTWQYGNISIGKLEHASVNYCLKYMSKDKKIPKYKGDKRVPEFALMSKGMGDNYLTPENIKLHQENIEHMYCVFENGTKTSLPRYYKQRIFDTLELEQIGKIFAFKRMENLRDTSVQKLLMDTKKRIVKNGKLPKKAPDKSKL